MMAMASGLPVGGSGRRAARLRGAGPADSAAAPMGEMNTTPLIDVMLVLLIMFIVTIPMSTHAVKLDLPGPSSLPFPPDPVRNTLSIDRAGGVAWNGRAVDRAQLSALMVASEGLDAEPELDLAPDPEAPYAAVDSVLADAKRADVRRMGFVGNAQYAGVF